MSAFDLGIIFTAKDMASAHMDRLKKNFSELDDGIQQSQKNFAKYATAFAAGLGIMVAGAKIAAVPLSFVSVASDFQKSLVAMQAATGYAAEDMRKMEAEAIRLGVATQFSPDQAVAAMHQIGSSGYDAATSLKIVSNAVSLAGASMGQIGMDVASSTMVAALQSFGIAAEKSKHVADALTRTTQITNLTFKDFDSVIAGAGSAASAAHQDLETMLASIGLMKLQGGTALQSTEKFRMALEAIKKPAAESGFKTLGMQVTDLMKNGKFIELPDMLDKIQAGLIKVKGADASDTFIKQQEALGKIFGIEGATAFNKMMKASFTDTTGKALKGSDALRAAIADLRKEQDTAANANKAYLDSFAGLSDLLEGTIQTIKIVLGKALIKDASTAIRALNENFMAPFLNMLMASPPLAAIVSKGILGIGLALMTVGAAIAGFAGFAMLKAAMITAGITASGVFAGIGSAIAAAFWPLTLTVALVAGTVLAWKYNFMGFRDFLTGFFSNLWNSAKGFFSGFSTGFDMTGFIADMQPYVETAKMVFSDLSGAIGEVIKALGLVESAGDVSGATESGQAFGEVIRGIVQPAVQIISAAIIGATTAIKWLVEGFNMLGDTGQNVAFGVIAAFFPFIGIPLLIIKNWDLVSGLFSGLMGILSGAGNAFLDFAFNIPVWIAAGVSKAQIMWVQFKAAVGDAVAGALQFFANLPGQIGQFILNIPAMAIGGLAALAVLFAAAFMAIAGLAGQLVVDVVTFFWNLPGQLGMIAMMVSSYFITGLAAIIAWAGSAVMSIITFFWNLPGQLAAIAANAAAFVISGLIGIVIGIPGIISSIVGFFWGLPGQLAKIGMDAASGLVNALARGIQDQASRITNSVRDMVQKARALLPGSDAKEGPLSDLTHSGRMLPRTFAMGMEQTAQEPRDLLERTVRLEPQGGGQPMAMAPTLLPAEGGSRVEELLESLVNMVAGGGAGGGNVGPRIVQLVLDRQVLAEVNLDQEDDFFRRSYSI